MLAHSTFSDFDGVPFSARNVKVSKVSVTTKDIGNMPYRVDMAWKL